MTASTNFSENNAIQQHKQLNQLRKKCIPCNSIIFCTMIDQQGVIEQSCKFNSKSGKFSQLKTKAETYVK